MYDLIQVEDDHELREYCACAAQNVGLSFMHVGSLKGLEKVLTQSDARFYIVDGRFPREDSGRVLDLAEEAIGMIRTAYPSASIIVHSNSSKAEEVAKKLKVENISKDCMPAALMSILSRRIFA